MIKISILEYTTKEPLNMIGTMAGICWESKTDDKEKNIKRAIDCAVSGHGRTLEFPDVYMVIEGCSARVIREWYTHIGGSPTRLQSSTRYVNERKFDFVTPPKIQEDEEKKKIFEETIESIRQGYEKLLSLGTTKEDAAMLLPLGMTTKIVDKRNFRNLMDMSRQRMCNRAYWEYRKLFAEIKKELSAYSKEWKWLCENYLFAKCEKTKTCPENNTCGRFPKAENTNTQFE